MLLDDAKENAPSSFTGMSFSYSSTNNLQLPGTQNADCMRVSDHLDNTRWLQAGDYCSSFSQIATPEKSTHFSVPHSAMDPDLYSDSKLLEYSLHLLPQEYSLHLRPQMFHGNVSHAEQGLTSLTRASHSAPDQPPTNHDKLKELVGCKCIFAKIAGATVDVLLKQLPCYNLSSTPRMLQQLLYQDTVQADERLNLGIRNTQCYGTSLPTLLLCLDFQPAMGSHLEDSIADLLEDFEYEAILKDAEMVAVEDTLQITLVPSDCTVLFPTTLVSKTKYSAMQQRLQRKVRAVKCTVPPRLTTNIGGGTQGEAAPVQLYVDALGLKSTDHPGEKTTPFPFSCFLSSSFRIKITNCGLLIVV